MRGDLRYCYDQGERLYSSPNQFRSAPSFKIFPVLHFGSILLAGLFLVPYYFIGRAVTNCMLLQSFLSFSVMETNSSHWSYSLNRKKILKITISNFKYKSVKNYEKDREQLSIDLTSACVSSLVIDLYMNLFKLRDFRVPHVCNKFLSLFTCWVIIAENHLRNLRG